MSKHDGQLVTNSNGYELSRVPGLVARGGLKELLGARGALLTAAEEIMETCTSAARSMTPDEQRNIDDYMNQIRDINEDLAEYKRQRIAANTSDLPVIFPF